MAKLDLGTQFVGYGIAGLVALVIVRWVAEKLELHFSLLALCVIVALAVLLSAAIQAADEGAPPRGSDEK